VTEDQWSEYLRRSKTWSIRMGHDLLHSKAYRDLTYGPAIKALNWFYEKIRVEVNKKKRGKDRYQVINGDIDFTYREAGFRGLSPQKFSKALKELHRFGFIDVTQPGSALKGDWTRFAFSSRWKDFGTPNFRPVEFPQSVHWVNFGFGAKRKHVRKKLDMRIHT
jgi:hypothetical protein